MMLSDGASIVHIGVNDPAWPALLEHLDRVDQRRHAFGPDGSLPEGSHFIAVTYSGMIVGNIGLRVQPLAAPPTSASADQEHVLRDSNGTSLNELYVETFAVEPEYRRRGYGRTLQLAALTLARELGCYQLRSWSTIDRTENYALKLSLGFAVHPGIHRSTTTGIDYSGVFFIKVVD